MKLDKKALDRLLSMNDSQLTRMIEKAASESGLDLSTFGITSNDISSVRKALSGATDEDIKKANEALEQYKRRGK
ncbi:MAG: hypothetical protein IKK94_00925 [Clostridia bacterium]|nr:hypothetical protein [Clostridia bacterium]MBR6602557.1 hypothetical protein [Clostridia bacterium]